MHVVLGWRSLLPYRCDSCGLCLRGHYSSSIEGHPRSPHDRHLTGPLSDYAVCYGFAPHIRREMGYDQAPRPEEHDLAPHEDCTCGFFGLWRPDARWGGYLRRFGLVAGGFWAYVVALGKTCLHVHGFRCYRYRVLRLFPPQPAEDLLSWREASVFGGGTVQLAELVERLTGSGISFEDADWREVELPTGLMEAERAAPIIDALLRGLPWREALTQGAT